MVHNDPENFLGLHIEMWHHSLPALSRKGEGLDSDMGTVFW